MRITVLQMDIVWGCPDTNIRKAQRLMNLSPDSDLYVLPEMWSTGFATLPEGIADHDDVALSWMRQQAINKHCAICGSVSIEADGYRNRTYFVYPDGSWMHYDKHHLFGYGGENERYVAGNSRTVVNYLGMRWLLVTCYDIRFPMWCRYRDDYDGIIVTASWPSTRRQVWDVLLRARAIENQCFVIASNRVGSDPNCEYNGGSMVIDAKGQLVAQCEDNRETIVTADISLESLHLFREKFKVLYDRDKI
ncbi:MAG: nitrilase family protein [Prevotella sp.]|nr:nitrilase family protein [Prevotella sp.]